LRRKSDGGVAGGEPTSNCKTCSSSGLAVALFSEVVVGMFKLCAAAAAAVLDLIVIGFGYRADTTAPNVDDERVTSIFSCYYASFYLFFYLFFHLLAMGSKRKYAEVVYDNEDTDTDSNSESEELSDEEQQEYYFEAISMDANGGRSAYTSSVLTAVAPPSPSKPA
jgi:hypothetical protein